MSHRACAELPAAEWTARESSAAQELATQQSAAQESAAEECVTRPRHGARGLRRLSRSGSLLAAVALSFLGLSFLAGPSHADQGVDAPAPPLSAAAPTAETASTALAPTVPIAPTVAPDTAPDTAPDLAAAAPAPANAPDGASAAPAAAAAPLPAALPSAASLLGDADAEEPSPDEAGVPAPTLADLQARYNRALLDGVRGFRSKEAPGEIIVGDNTDPWGMTWTKCTNLGIDLVATLVAERRGLIAVDEARQNIRGIVDILRKLKTHRGIFPENILIRGGIAGEVVQNRARFSSIDSAWVTLALSLVAANYKSGPEGLGRDAAALISGQDYGTFVDAGGALGAGYYVDVATDQKVEEIPFSYKDRNSEARPLVLALVGMGQLPASAWSKTLYLWDNREGLALAKGWHFSAFVEMTGALFFDEAKLAPRSLGKSHENYIQASLRVARRNGHQFWGYAPACDARNAYAEFGLDRPDSVSPYAAALLTLTGNPQAIQNLGQVLASLPSDGRALPDGLDPRTGAVSCGVARLLDQGLLFLALNADVVRGLVEQTPWYASAKRRLTAMDRTQAPPPRRAPLREEPPMSFLDEPLRGPAPLPLALLSDASLP